MLRIRHPFQGLEEAGFGIHPNHPHAHVLGKGGHDLVAFVVTQQAVIDKHTGELIANRLVQQGGNDRGIHAAGQTQQDFILPHLLTNDLNTVINDVIRGPQATTAGNIMHKALNNALPLASMGHFRVELQTVKVAIFIGHSSNRRAVRRCH